MMSAGIFSEGGLLANIFGHSTTHEAEEIIEKIGVVTYKYTKFVMGSGLSTFTRKGKVAFEHLEEYLKVHYNIDAEFKTGVMAFFGNKENSYSKDGKPLTFYQVLDIIG